jgi:hypothetical protein
VASSPGSRHFLPPPPPPPHHHQHQLKGRPLWPLPVQKLTSENIFGHLVGLLGQVIGPSQRQYPHRRAQYRKTWTHIHASSGIRTHDPSVRAVADSTCIRSRGHWDRPSLLGPYILLSTLFSNTVKIFSSLGVRIQISHPYKTTGKLVFNTLILSF